MSKVIASALVLLSSACSNLGPALCQDYRRNNEWVDCKELEKPLDGGADADGGDAAKETGDAATEARDVADDG
ncbi:MAG TPA: hypothetical protein VGF45_08505 [Polyangia bacterium]